MKNNNFDQSAEKYAAWFLENTNVLYSEAALVAYFLRKGEKILSIGCGSGLFERILRTDYDITVEDGVEPSSDMAQIARARGMKVTVATAEDYVAAPESYDTILYNLAKALGTWDHPLLEGVQPKDPYPIELVTKACWRTTAEKVGSMRTAGFSDFEYAQTLTTHPLNSGDYIQKPLPGYDSGDYVAICGYKR